MIFRLIRRNVSAKPFRFLLTCSAVTLGVMFTVGVFVFTDSLRSTFGDLAQDIQGNFDIQVRSEIPFGERIDAPQVPVELIDTLAQIDGVEAVQPRIISLNTIPIDGDGDAQITVGPPNLGVNWEAATPNPRLFAQEGRAPAGPGEFALDVDAFAGGNFVIGETYTVLTNDTPLDFKLVGTFTFADPETNALIGAKLVAFDTATALEVLNRNVGYDDITIVAGAGVDQTKLITRIEAALPSGFEVLTNDQVADEQAQDFDEFIGQIQTFLIVFAFIILLVSAFVIYNVFSILIGQRIRELGLLRAIGASGRQVTAALLGEAAMVAIFSTAVGIVSGIGLGWTLRWLLARFDFGPQGNALLLEPSTFIWGAIVGIGVTMASAVVPALRARHVSPMAALRSDARLGRKVPDQNIRVGIISVALATLLVVTGLLRDDWKIVGLLSLNAVAVNAFGWRRISAQYAKYATPLMSVLLLILSLVVPYGTGTVLVLLGVAALAGFIGLVNVSPGMAPAVAGFLGRWPLAVLLGIGGVVTATLGLAGSLGALVLVGLSFKDLVTDFDAAGLFALAGSLIPLAFGLLVLLVGIRSVDASFILGWKTRKVIAGIGVFVVGAVGVAMFLTGFLNLVTADTSTIALLPIGVALIALARWLQRFLPRRMKSNARMARENSRRSPQRTAAAAAALMIGLALVSTATVVASSFKATFAEILSDSVTSDWFISGNQGDPNAAFSTDLANDLEKLGEVESVVRFRFSFEAFRTIPDEVVRDASATDLVASLDHLDPDFSELDRSLLGRNAIWTHEDFANDNGYVLGDSFEIEFPDQVVETVTLAGIYRDASIYGNRTISLDLWADRYPTSSDQFLSLTTVEGVSEEQARAAIQAVTDDYPQLNVDTRQEFQDRQEGQIGQFLTVINVLLLVAIAIALLGIAITLALSVFERTRELGLVRAVGMTSQQMTRMVLFEGAIIAVFGGVLGVALGTVLGSAAVVVIPDTFIRTVDIPVAELLEYLAVAAIAGIGAAIVPARRAARLNVLEAISNE